MRQIRGREVRVDCIDFTAVQNARPFVDFTLRNTIDAEATPGSLTFPNGLLDRIIPGQFQLMTELFESSDRITAE